MMQYQVFIGNLPAKNALQKIVQVKMKTVLKIIKQPLRVVPPKTAVYTISTKTSKIMKNTHEGAHFQQNGRHTACSFTRNEPPTGIPQV